MGEVNYHCRKPKALAVQSQGEIWAAGTFLYSGPSRRLCSSLLRQRLLCLDLCFIMSRVASCWHIPCVVGCRGHTEQGTKQGGKKIHALKVTSVRRKQRVARTGSAAAILTLRLSVWPPASLPALFQVRSVCAGCVPIVQEPKSPSAEPLKSVASSLHLAMPLLPHQCYPNPPQLSSPKELVHSFLSTQISPSLLFFYQTTFN